jgi:hypothetical protein
MTLTRNNQFVAPTAPPPLGSNEPVPCMLVTADVIDAATGVFGASLARDTERIQALEAREAQLQASEADLRSRNAVLLAEINEARASLITNELE